MDGLRLGTSYTHEPVSQELHFDSREQISFNLAKNDSLAHPSTPRVLISYGVVADFAKDVSHTLCLDNQSKQRPLEPLSLVMLTKLHIILSMHKRRDFPNICITRIHIYVIKHETCFDYQGM